MVKSASGCGCAGAASAPSCSGRWRWEARRRRRRMVTPGFCALKSCGVCNVAAAAVCACATKKVLAWAPDLRALGYVKRAVSSSSFFSQCCCEIGACNNTTQGVQCAHHTEEASCFSSHRSRGMKVVARCMCEGMLPCAFYQARSWLFRR